MRINITGRKIHLSDRFKDLVEKKLSKFEKIFHDADVYVTVTLEKNHETVEVTINQHGMIYRAEKTAEHKSEALDQVIDVLGRQIRKHKAKLEKKIKSGSIDDMISPELHADELEDEKDYEIIRTKRFSLKPMNVQEAILQMNMIGHEFYMFMNSDTDEINLVYRRKNNSYGLFEPDSL